MVKKFLAVLCSMGLTAALLCGCWGKDSSSSSSQAQASPTPGSSSVSDSMSGSGSMLDGSDSVLDNNGGMPGDDLEGGSGAGSMLPDSGSDMSGASTKPTLNSSWNLTLVNAENPLPGDFSVSVRSIAGYDDRQFDARAADALEAMLKDAAAAGQKLYLVSAYRSVTRQTALYERKVNWYLGQGYAAPLAKTQAAKWVAVPGTSEHNLGLAADVVSSTWYRDHDDLTGEFDQTPEFAWLAAHSAEYGFVLRYPKDKESVTGIGYEPWHYRYVGQQAAAYLTEQGLCLEELAD